MTAKALLVATYGTANASAWAAACDPLATDLAAACPNREIAFSCAGDGVRRLLEDRCEPLPSVADSLGRLASAGVGDVLVCRAVVSDGRTSERIECDVREAAPLFDVLRLSEPLLASDEDARELASSLDARHPRAEGIFHLLVGHGAGMRADSALRSVQRALERLGREDMATTTLRKRDGLPRLLEALPSSVIEVRLVPLMLFAGIHVNKELAGTEAGSWASCIAARGLGASCVQEGLAELPGVRSIIVRHAQSALPSA